MKVKANLLAALLVLLVPLSVGAQVGTTSLTGTEVFDPFNLFGNGAVGAILNPGDVTCPGTQPTGNPLQPCPPGSRTHVRGTMFTSRLASEDAWLDGWFTLNGNSHMDANAVGVGWGEFRLDLDAGEGVWVGTWTGKRRQIENLGWTTLISGVGRGIGGSVDGKQLRFSEAITGFGPAYVGSIVAEVLSPPSSE